MPPSTPLSDPGISEAVTAPEKSEARFPKRSSAVAMRPNDTPAVTLPVGWLVTTSRTAGAAPTAIGPVVTTGRAPLETSTPTPLEAWSNVRSEKPAIPPPGHAFTVPPSVSSTPGRGASDTVTNVL